MGQCHLGKLVSRLLIVIQKPKLQPRMEAMLRLRYARILYVETENDADAETALSKGVSCFSEREKYAQ